MTDTDWWDDPEFDPERPWLLWAKLGGIPAEHALSAWNTAVYQMYGPKAAKVVEDMAKMWPDMKPETRH